MLDRDQLRSITLDDDELAREVLSALVDDTSQQIEALRVAIERADAAECRRVAHYAKGACANLGASSAAVLLQQIERSAKAADFAACARCLHLLGQELDKLRQEAVALNPPPAPRQSSRECPQRS